MTHAEIEQRRPNKALLRELLAEALDVLYGLAIFTCGNSGMFCRECDSLLKGGKHLDSCIIARIDAALKEE